MPEAFTQEFMPSGNGFDLAPFHALIRRLRDPEQGCPWDVSRTLPSMGETLREEAAEAAEALAANDYAHQCEELGDVLLNVMLAVVIAESEGRFAWTDVVRTASEKLVRRHPHVFGGIRAASPEEAMRMFQTAKAEEKTARDVSRMSLSRVPSCPESGTGPPHTEKAI